CFFFFFFFQAEDGIRDLIVTGVQTCALPICVHGLDRTAVEDRDVEQALDQGVGFLRLFGGRCLAGADRPDGLVGDDQRLVLSQEIGRASCRERGEVWVGGGAV